MTRSLIVVALLLLLSGCSQAPAPTQKQDTLTTEYSASPSSQAAPEKSTVPEAGSAGSKTQFKSGLDFKGAER